MLCEPPSDLSITSGASAPNAFHCHVTKSETSTAQQQMEQQIWQSPKGLWAPEYAMPDGASLNAAEQDNAGHVLVFLAP